MTMVRPCRLITRQRSHMGLTDGRTFMGNAFVKRDTAGAHRHLPGDAEHYRTRSSFRDDARRSGRTALVRWKDAGSGNSPAIAATEDAPARLCRAPRRLRLHRGTSSLTFAGSVRMRGPSAVTATVCSKWAASEPSEVEIDQPSEWR